MSLEDDIAELERQRKLEANREPKDDAEPTDKELEILRSGQDILRGPNGTQGRYNQQVETKGAADFINWGQDKFDHSQLVSDDVALRILSKQMPTINVNDRSWIDSQFGGKTARHAVEGLTDPWLGLIGLNSPKDKSTKSISEARANVLMKVIAMIPDDMQSQDFMENADFRVILDQLAMESTRSSETINGVIFTAQEMQIAGQMVTQRTEDLRQVWEKELIASVPDGDTVLMEAAIKQSQELADEYKDGSVTRIAELSGSIYRDPNTGELATTSGSTGGLDDFLAGLDVGGGTMTATRFLSSEDIKRLVQSGDLDIDSVGQLGTEPSGSFALDGAPIVGADRVLYSDETTQRTNQNPYGNANGNFGPITREAKDASNWDQKDWYSIRDMKRLPNDMTQTEKLELHEKMKKAGLYDLAGGDPIVPGDTTDPAFKAAYAQLISQSLETGTSMTALLTDRAVAYNNEIEASLATRLTDPAAIRRNANAYSRDSIGRSLTDDEHLAMQNYIHDLERQNVKVEAGLDMTAGTLAEGTAGIESLDEGIVADIDARMEQYVRDENPVEAESHDMASQYEMFSAMLAGPGRGVAN